MLDNQKSINSLEDSNNITQIKPLPLKTKCKSTSLLKIEDRL